ncbi:hypothetical protein ATHSA_0363 [Athalassotoga saccharophila]|nr:hypothetical protein ATHSA_0363 [Athalassotoga saccharophila]
MSITSVGRIFGTERFYTLVAGCCGVIVKKELRNSEKFQN